LSFFNETGRLFLRTAVTVLLVGFSALPATAQNTSEHPDAISIQGTVADAGAKPLVNAMVRLAQKGGPEIVTATTGADGGFVFPALPAGAYILSAAKAGFKSSITAVDASLAGVHKRIDLVLEPTQGAQPAAGPSPTPAGAMEFADQPNFTVAGVTDWTAAGGHGSDTTLRASEALARETLTLKPEARKSAANADAAVVSQSEGQLRTSLSRTPESFEANHNLGKFYLRGGRYRDAIPLLETAYKIQPANRANEFDLAMAYKGAGDFAAASEHVQKLLAAKDDADLHRLLGDIDEAQGNPLAAVHEYELAVRLDPSEENYFVWGSELLLHRAVWQAQEVFGKGVGAHPKSARMLVALGTALFAGALYDQAAARVCEASDMNPADAEPYVFLGKIEAASPNALGCVEPKLARFVREQPENSLANYLYAMAIWKRLEQPVDSTALGKVQEFLTKAITIDANCGDGYLQLGILNASRRDYAKAIEFYTKAIEVNPQLVEAYYRLGVAYDRTGEAAKAKQEFQLHDEIKKRQQTAVDQQRREVKQFVVVQPEKPNPSQTQ
jgi:tetratricopeptide (TPR) repeat protein